MVPPASRNFSRSLFRGYLDELRRTGLYEAVRAGASERLRGMLDRPQDVPAWIDGAPFDELTRAIEQRRGRAGLRELGYSVMKHGFSSVMEPIIHVALRFVGGPASLFSRAHLMLAVFSRGVEMEWRPGGAAQGTMQVRCVEPIPAINWIAWEGCLAYGLELANATGTVGEARPAADGRSAEIDVRWDAK